MKIQNISYSHESIKYIKELKKHPVSYFNEIEDLSIFEFLMKDNKKLELFIYCPELINKQTTEFVVDYYIKNSKEVYEVSKKVYLSIVEKENAQGLIGVYYNKPLKLKDFSEKKFVVVLDHLENPGNIGTLFRTCDGCDVDGVIIVDEIVKSESYKVIQSSRGMSLFVDKVIDSYENVQKFLLDNNFDIYLGEPVLGNNYQEYSYDNKIALVIGNERYGINKNWYNNKNLKVFIPMVGKMTSLNVSIAGSILIYEAFMKRISKK